MTRSPFHRRWFRFSLRTLFVLLTAAAIGVWAYSVLRDVREATAAWSQTVAAHEAHAITVAEIHAASIRLRTAQSRVPLQARAAGRAHLDRMREIESRYQSELQTGVYDNDHAQATLQKLGNYCREAEAWLANP